MKIVSIKWPIVIITICLFCIFTRLIFSTGICLTSDDSQYSQAAHEISRSNFQIPTNHWNARIGNTLSISLSYLIFGINKYSAIGASIFFSVLNILLIYMLSQEIFEKDFSKKIGSIASVLFTFVPVSIVEGSSIQFGQGLTFFMFLSIYILLQGERKGHPLYYFLSGLCIGISYLFHATGAYTFLMIATYFIVKRKLNKRIFLILFGFFLIFACENLIYYSFTGKLFYRQRVTLGTHFGVKDIKTVSDIMMVKTKFETIDNPFSGTFIGDSWLLEPFRWILLHPATSIIYHLFFLISIHLIVKRDEKLILLNLLFWPLFLYYSYGSPNPLSYVPLRRLPRYILPCLIPVCIAVSYGTHRILRQNFHQIIVILSFVFISMFCISIKGGEIGQKFHQSKFFYKFIKENPDEQYITDSLTLIGLKFLSKYQKLNNVKVIDYRDFIHKINEHDFVQNNGGSYLLTNIPESYGCTSVNLDKLNYTLIAKNERKPRKICYIPTLKGFLKNNLCDLSNGGKIYEINNNGGD